MEYLGAGIFLLFYGFYLGKMIMQKRRGIQTDQLAKSKQRDQVFYTELALKLATYAVAAAEAISIWIIRPPFTLLTAAGTALGLLGDGLFIAAVLTMKDSWRAGIAKNDQTRMVTDGIYALSRNPAFLAFDCLYIGLSMMFFSWWLLALSALAIALLHLQILQEERHLSQVFGEEYARYRRVVCRYLGRKRP